MRIAPVVVGAVFVLAACTSGTGTSSPPAGGPTPPASTAPSGSSRPLPSGSESTGPAAAVTDWPMYHGRPDHAGLSSSMPTARGTPRVVESLKLDGAVFASPIVVGAITVVATENDTVYAFDSAYRQLWKVSLGDPSPAQERPCGNIDPLGITGTPIYSPATDEVYVAAELGGPPRHVLVALALQSGTVRWSRSLDLAGVATSAMQERGALTVTGGRVWVPFGGLAGDCGNYKGRLVGIDLNGGGKPAAYTVPTAREGGIWTPPGPTLDSDGQMYVSVGNGASGVGGRYDLSDSVLELSSAGTLLDSFSPSTWASDNDHDLDLGSLGPTLVSGEKWVLAVGKSGYAYVLRRSKLGGIGGQVSRSNLCTAFGGTATVGDIVYVPCTDGLRAVRIDSAGALRVQWHAGSAIAGSPVVGGGRVWALDQSAGVLHALDPATGRSVAAVPVGKTSRFATPALSGRNVIVPTLAGIAVVRTS